MPSSAPRPLPRRHRLPWLAADLLEGWLSSPARTALILTAVASAALMLTLLTAILSGLSRRAEALLTDFGANAAILEPAVPGTAPLPHSLLLTLQAQFPEAVWVGERRHDTRLPGHPAPVPLYAATPHWHSARGLPLTAGRAPDPADLHAGDAYALTGTDLNLPPGTLFRLHTTELLSVGTAPGAFIQVPATLRGDWERPGDPGHYHRIRLLHLRGDPAPLLRETRILLDTELPALDLRILTPDLLLAGTRRLRHTLQTVFGTVTALSLLLGLSTLGSLMMQTVRQRLREIGLRFALGASRQDIFRHIILEGFLLSAAGALLGTALGTLLLRWLPAGLDLPPPSLPLATGIPFTIMILTGALFSWLPARAAARISPAQALRSDE